jgi:hypothetical protein
MRSMMAAVLLPNLVRTFGYLLVSGVIHTPLSTTSQMSAREAAKQFGLARETARKMPGLFGREVSGATQRTSGMRPVVGGLVVGVVEREEFRQAYGGRMRP